MRENFDRALAEVLAHEGGWSNHKSDPGGATMKGVIQRTYDAYRDRKGRIRQSVRHIGGDELQEIYKRDYWDQVGGDTLYPGVDLATFDLGVNSGVGRARKLLPKAVGSDNHAETVRRLCALRMSFLRGLGTFSTFGKGWAKRVARVEAVGVSWALAAMGKGPDTIKANLRIEAEHAGSAADGQKKAAGGAGAVTGGTAVSAPSTGDESTFWIFIAVMVAFALVAGFALYRSRINRDRAKAYAAVAEGIGR